MATLSHLPVNDVGTVTVQEKSELDVEVENIPADDSSDYHRAENGEKSQSTPADVRHMQRMGRNQQLVRNFRLISIASFVAMCTAAWELGIFIITPALTDGGIPALIYGTIWNFIGFGPIYLSMAEMASMAPIAGAQYHWVSEFAPARYQKILSYLTGWTSTLAWQAGNAMGVFLVGTLIQALISINNPDYTFPNWHGTLLVIAATLIALVGNVYGSRVLHLWQNAAFLLHVAAYFVLIIPIWVKAEAVPHEKVWLEWENYGGWSSMGLAVLAGQLSGISQQVGIDTVSGFVFVFSFLARGCHADDQKAAHMAEEVKDASRQIPKAMIAVYLINFAILFPCFITIAYHIPSVEDALADPTLYPVIYVLRQAWSPAGITAILVITIVILIFSNIAYLAAVTRDCFAFARDQGLPFSSWIARVDKKRAIPVNAAVLTSAISILLSLIYIGSPVAFYAITSLVTVALLQCYCLSIGCVLWRRIYHPETLPPAHFSLGRWGIPMNISAVIYSLWCFFWSFWPQVTPVSASDFNWASVLFIVTLILSAGYFMVKGRKVYHGPVALVEGRRD